MAGQSRGQVMDKIRNHKQYQYLGYKEGDFPVTEEYANEVLSIPLYNGMTKEEQDYVIECINQF